MRIIDITQPLVPGIPVWPGDQPLEPRWSARIADGSSVNVGAVTMSLHTGTHADAPLHYAEDGASIDRLPLTAFIGPCLVVEARGEGAIRPEELPEQDLTEAPRVLFRTDSFDPSTGWTNLFRYLSVELVHVMSDRGAVLVGIDTPSVDPADSKTLDAHHALKRKKLVNIENLNLRHVSPGRYELVALPVAIEGMDAGPVRAVLISEG